MVIEFKRPGEEPEPHQLKKIRILRKRGYTVEVHDDAEAAKSSIASALEAAQVHAKGGGVASKAPGRRNLRKARPR